ncbi:MAG TPA: methyl-accepting chemotaxis protein [Telmatospirillum sp.]|nr:methyl-accepting chemotaxis protein [Telmatospirillum sp.]
MTLSFRKMPIGARLTLIVALAIGMFVFSTGIRLNKIYDQIYAARIAQVKSVVEVAYSITADYAARVDKGEMTRQAAEDAVKTALNAMRYAGNEYILVFDYKVVMVLNPMTPQNVGTDRSTANKDANGKYFSAEMVRLAKERGEGVVDYLFPKPGGTVPLPKAVFVKAFAPWQWVIGSGVYIDDVQAAVRNEMIEEGAIGLGALLFLLLVSYGIGRAISRPIRSLTEVMRRVAVGDLTVDVIQDQGAEIGAMQETVRIFKDNAAEVLRLTEEQKLSAAKAASDRRDMMLRLADEFERSVTQVVEGVSSAARQMHGTAEGMTAIAAQALQQSELVAAASDKASASVSTVAAATEELHASITEISRQVHQSAAISRQAVDTAKETDVMVCGLAEAARKIDDVVNLINSIASQTNLLALNATIEAARAGDAGKGFAVVAGEVKNLASQTGHATGEIAQQVAGVQAATGQAVEAIRAIATTIGEISQIASAIASAVEQQGAATHEISNNTQKAAEGTSTVSLAAGKVTSAAADVGRSAQTVLNQAGDLATEATALQEAVSLFLAGIRST